MSFVWVRPMAVRVAMRCGRSCSEIENCSSRSRIVIDLVSSGCCRPYNRSPGANRAHDPVVFNYIVLAGIARPDQHLVRVSFVQGIIVLQNISGDDAVGDVERHPAEPVTFEGIVRQGPFQAVRIGSSPVVEVAGVPRNNR